MKTTDITIRSIVALIFIYATTFNIYAQNTESAYFNDEYMYRFKMNPAIGNSRGFVSFRQ